MVVARTEPSTVVIDDCRRVFLFPVLYKADRTGIFTVPEMAEPSKTYNPADVEEKWHRRWDDSECFRGDESSEKQGYSIVIPPPNVTGILHLGHVLNNTIQDILCRRARQADRAVLWLPGTDHAGIATQTKVERRLREEESKTRHDLGRDAFLERVWQWKEKHGGIITTQLKKLGCSCDWSRERFTMDEGYSKWVSHVFVKLFEEGLIYRGRRMVNWCPVSLTALSDEEVIMKPQRSKLYTMRYELADTQGNGTGEFLEIATTRPETLMGDTGVAVNPKDPRYGRYVGRTILRPFPRAAIPIVADEHIDIEFGTGVLKVTPAHDRADFEIGQRHGLPAIDVLTPDGHVNCPEVPQLHGLERFEARRRAVEILAEMDLLVSEEDYQNNIGFSERADVPIEPRLSMQWFLRYPSVQRAIDAVAGDEIVFRPKHWKKTYLRWMENIQDWCISRQLWWGHRIPVWYRREDAASLKEKALDVVDRDRGEIHVGIDSPADPENWEQDEDVLDTWFSSWLWPFATMTECEGADSETVKKFYPTADLSTGPDIIFFWVARMIMAGLHFRGESPFKNVYFHSIIRDIKGRKMSKSLGNSPDPLDLIAQYGADGLRFGLLRIAPTGTDVRYDEKQIEAGRNFATKLWNACRYRQMQDGNQADGHSPARPLAECRLSPFDIDILARVERLRGDLDIAFEEYRFNEATALLYEFFWSNFCDRYLESIKEDFREGADVERKVLTLAVIDEVLRYFLPLLHPVMPHITEEIWEQLGLAGDGGGPLATQVLGAQSPLAGVAADAVAAGRELAARTYEAAGRVRNLKADYNLASRKDVPIILKPVEECAVFGAAGGIGAGRVAMTLQLLAGAGSLAIDATFAAPGGTPSILTDLGEICMPLDGLIDMDAERARVGKELAKVDTEVDKAEKKLANPKFVENAKAEVVEEARQRLTEWQEKRERLSAMLENLA